VYHLKRNLAKITHYGTKIESEAGPPRPPTSPVTLESRSPRLLGRCSRQLRKSCAGENRTCVREAFSSAYPDKKVLNKTTIHRRITKFPDTSVCVYSRRWLTSAVKLFCKFFLTKNKNKQKNLFRDIYVTTAYKCCS
jgi:hypothetical protein